MTQFRAADVAACIISEALDSDKPASNLRLQKLLFFCQCKHLQTARVVLFPDDIVAWQYGPVVRSVYHVYSYRGASPIKRAALFVEDHTSGRAPIKQLDRTSLEIVRDVLSVWLTKPAWDLVNKTHQQGGAWDKVYNAGGIMGSGYGNTIPISLMMEERLT